MTSNLEQRLYRLEAQLAAIQQQIASILSRLAALEQQQYATGGGSGGGGSSNVVGFCQLGSTLVAATGTWPSITPQPATGVSIYTATSGGLSAAGTGTIYNFRNVAWAASKTTYLTQASDGSWIVIDQDC